MAQLLCARTGALRPLPPASIASTVADSVARALLVTVVAAALAVGGAAAVGVRPHVEASDSMRPALRAGDVVWLDDVDARDIRARHVVAFAHPERGDIVLHRVVSVEPDGGDLRFVTRGDANSGVERWTIDAGGSVGRYAGVRVPLAGRAARTGAPVAMFALLGGLALATLRRIWR